MSSVNAQQLRQNLISLRKKLSPESIQNSARLLAQRIGTLDSFKEASRIAVYLPVNGEADPSEIKQKAWAGNKSVYLPVIKGERLLFAPFRPQIPLVRGQFNIPVPKHDQCDLLDPAALDVVITPLVAFDSNLNRVGMGGGFYDKTFAFRQNNSKKPELIGIAHELQRIENVESQSWDIPMDRVVTEKTIYSKPKDTQ